jgi:hypothetical protein
MNYFLLLFLFLTLSATSATSASDSRFEDTKHLPWSEPIFGPEFTFIRYDANIEKYVEATTVDLNQLIHWLAQHLITNQPKNEKFKRQEVETSITPLYRDTFYSPDGWSFTAKPDQGVIEVTMSPKTYNEFLKHAANIQDAIFASASHESLYPALFTGGGHISIDRTLFDNNALLFRNFIVDFCNHNELAMGVLNYDTNNALPFYLLNPNKIEKISKAIERFDASYNPSPFRQKMQVDTLSEDISQILKAASDYDLFNWNLIGFTRTNKYHALGFLHFHEGRLEVRAARPQASFDVFLRQIRLFRNRLKFLSQIRKPLKLRPHVKIQLHRPDRDDRFDPPVDPQEALRAFYIYVTEAGENWHDHRDYIWPAWVYPLTPVEPELIRFERSEWFRLQKLRQVHHQAQGLAQNQTRKAAITKIVSLANGCTVERLQTPYQMRNQGGTSTCWLHSALQMMEQMAGQSLSIDALLIPEIKSRALDRFLGHDTPWDGGAGPTRPFALALEHGLVPESVWNKQSVIVRNYHTIFSEIELLLNQNLTSKSEFLSAVEDIIKKYTSDLPPSSFALPLRSNSPTKMSFSLIESEAEDPITEVSGIQEQAIEAQLISAQDYARLVIGDGASVGFDFRDVKYDETKYGRMPDVAWRTIISQKNELVDITSVIAKNVERVSPEHALQEIERILSDGRPVAFTFIWSDHEGQTVVGLNSNREYVARRPPTQETYTGSHLVLVTGLIRDAQGQVTGFEVLDPLAQTLEDGFRIVTKDFFNQHGKTVHEIEKSCAQFLL